MTRVAHIAGVLLVSQALLVTGIVERAPADSRTKIVAALPPDSTQLPAYSNMAPAPPGFVAFCLRDPAQCRDDGLRAIINLTDSDWAAINAVNKGVNRAIWPEDDSKHYQRAEYWTIPTDGYGDCEDYALAKRAQLVAHGYAQSALRIAVVMTPREQRHAVLVVSTDKGDYVLDNLTDQIQPWRDKGYTWIEEQSTADPYKWVAMQTPAVIAEASRKPMSAFN
jgi:predicted transglutaminase-like cysteine proteinase